MSGGEVGSAVPSDSHSACVRGVCESDPARLRPQRLLDASLAAAMRAGRPAAQGLCSAQSWIL